MVLAKKIKVVIQVLHQENGNGAKKLIKKFLILVYVEENGSSQYSGLQTRQ